MEFWNFSLLAEDQYLIKRKHIFIKGTAYCKGI